jgi:N-alpha-acetyltransferase 40
MSKCNAGGGAGKVKIKGSSNTHNIAVKKTKQMESTKAGTDKVLLLRAALFDEGGVDKNVLKDFLPFQTFKRNGLDCTIEFATGTSAAHYRKWMFALTKINMEGEYNIDYGWDDEDKKDELREPSARFLVVNQAPSVAWEKPIPVAFVHFRFTLQGEIFQQMKGETALFVYDIQVEQEYQKKGLGKHLMQLCELIGNKQRISHVQLLVPNGSTTIVNFLASKMKGYEEDNSHEMFLEGDVEDMGFSVHGKCIDRALKARNVAAAREKESFKQEVFDLCKLLDTGVKVASGATPKKKEITKKKSP